MNGIRSLTTSVAALVLSCGLGAEAMSQSATQRQRWQDWCEGGGNATREQTAQACINLMQSQPAPAVAPPSPQHTATAKQRAKPRAPAGEISPKPTSEPDMSPGDNASSEAFLRAARGAVAAGHLREAQDALEHAESRVLTRSESMSAVQVPSSQQLVRQIGDARAALSSGDRMRAVDFIESALSNPDLKESGQ